MLRPLHLPVLALLATIPVCLRANNIQVSNVNLTGQIAASDTWQIQFDLSWENSWRTSTAEANHDAAWVFMKFRAGADPTWRHAILSASGHVSPTGGALAPVVDLRGAFVLRNTDGIGNVSYTGVQLRWNYGASGVADNDVIEVRVLAVEMVLVPQAAFSAGDGTGSDIQRNFSAGTNDPPLTIGSEAALTLGGTASTSLGNHNNVDSGSGTDDDFNASTTQVLPAAFPKGFNAFYMMKYECTEGQYVDFLNMLTVQQASNRFPNTTGTLGNTMDDTGVAPELYVTSAPDRAASVRGSDMLAYADWAALRPMTELEFEKACRGNRPAVPNEYAWGNTSLRTTPVYGISNAGTANETVSALGSEGNANYSIFITPNRATRVGIFAGSLVAPDRTAAGASYYGAMELSGNLPELMINVGSPQGRAFTGAMGDGSIDVSGAATVTGWPIAGLPLAARGGGTGSLSGRIRVSDRQTAAISLSISGMGARLCRIP